MTPPGARPDTRRGALPPRTVSGRHRRAAAATQIEPGRLRRAAFALAALALVLLAPASPAQAHPIDEFVQRAYLTPAPSTVSVELDLSPGVLVAPAALAELDPDGNRRISDAEARAYAERVVGHLQLRADDRPLPLTLTGVEASPYLTFQAGYGTVKLTVEAEGAPAEPGIHRVFFRNDFAPKGSAYQVNAFVDRAHPVEVGTQHRDATQRQSVVEYRIGTAGGSAKPAAPSGNRLLGVLETPTALLFALGLAALLGALHALTPGHAKALTAAYLVGNGGTIRNALALGAVVTFTHTASVIVIGLGALVASRFLLPGVLVPVLELVSGGLVLLLGARLLKERRPRRARSPREPSFAARTGQHDARHHDAGQHAHGGRSHSHHLPPSGAGGKGALCAKGVIALGVSGGLVPCPEALGVMIMAVGVGRTAFGLGLIGAFSLGLAAVLMAVGVMVVRAQRIMHGFDARWWKALPLVSAFVVCALGIGLVAKAVDLNFG